jgi:hypothetical protein
VADKKSHPAEQQSVKQGYETFEYTTVAANSYKHNPPQSPKRAENQLYKTTIWRNNSTESYYNTTNKQNFKQLAMQEFVDNSERHKRIINSSITLGNDEHSLLTETRKTYIKLVTKRETVVKPDLQKVI